VLGLPAALFAEPIPAVTPTLIAATGKPAAGITSTTYASFNRPGLLETGEVWFTGTTALRESSVYVEGIWKTTAWSSTPTLVVRDTPGMTSTHFNLAGYSGQMLNPTQAIYLADYQTGHFGYFESGGVRTAFYQKNGVAPETGGALFGNSLEIPVGNASGQIATVMSLEGDGTRASALFTGSASSGMHVIIRQGDAAPGFASGTLSAFYQTRISPTGVVSVYAHSNGNLNARGIYQGTSAADFHQVIGLNQAAPGFANGKFSDFRETFAVNGGGKLAFIAKVSSPDTTVANEWGLWTNARGALDLIARTGDVAPGAEAITTGLAGTVFAKNFLYQSALQLNNAGHVVFNSGLGNVRFDNDSQTVPTAPSNRDAGIWFWADGALRAVAIEGMRAPGTPEGVLFNELNYTNLAFNNNDLVVFTGEFWKTGPYDGTVHNDNNSGLFVWSPGAGMHLLLQEGDFLEISPGDSRAISYFNFHGSAGGGDGLPISLNDDNQFVATINFKDGTQAIYQLDLSSYAIAVIPEASTFAIIAGLGALAFVGVRRKLAR
jgi:hypothetical protein